MNRESVSKLMRFDPVQIQEADEATHAVPLSSLASLYEDDVEASYRKFFFAKPNNK